MLLYTSPKCLEDVTPSLHEVLISCKTNFAACITSASNETVLLPVCVCSLPELPRACYSLRAGFTLPFQGPKIGLDLLLINHISVISGPDQGFFYWHWVFPLRFCERELQWHHFLSGSSIVFIISQCGWDFFIPKTLPGASVVPLHSRTSTEKEKE